MRIPRCFWKGLLSFAVVTLGASPAGWAQSVVQKVHLVEPGKLANLSWNSLTSEGQGDGIYRQLPDAKELTYALAPKGDLVWFKVRVYEPLPDRWLGINVAVDNDGNPDNGMSWWGTNKFKFDRLVSAYLNRADGYWQGVVGVGDSDSVDRGAFNNLSRDVRVAVDRTNREILIGLPRKALGGTGTFRVIATVGSSFSNNDDLPNEGAVSFSLSRVPPT